MILLQLSIVPIYFLLAYLDSTIPQSLAIEGYVSYESWISALVGAINGLGGLAGGLAGSYFGNKQAQRQADILDKAQSNLEDWRNGVINTNTLDRADSMSMVKAYRDILNEQNRKFNTGAIKGGLTDEAKVAQATATNKGLSDAISRIAGYGQQQKDRVEQVYQNRLHDYNLKRAEMAGAGAEATSSAISEGTGVITGVIGDILGSIDWDKIKKEKGTKITKN